MTAPTLGRLAIAVAIAAPTLAASPRSVAAGEVRIDVKFEPGKLAKPPKRTQGFLRRRPNALRPVKSIDPLPHLIAVLEGGPDGAGAARPPRKTVTYEVLGASFERPVLPVVAGSTVAIENSGSAPQVLWTPGKPDLMDRVPLAPGKKHRFAVTEPYQAVVVGAPSSSHPRGLIVAFPGPHFATADRRGRFSITGVPEGTWKIRLWYRDGWLEGVEEQVEVTRRRSEVTLRVPTSKLEPASGGAAE